MLDSWRPGQTGRPSAVALFVPGGLLVVTTQGHRPMHFGIEIQGQGGTLPSRGYKGAGM